MSAFCLVSTKSDNRRLNFEKVIGNHCGILLSSNLFQILTSVYNWILKKSVPYSLQSNNTYLYGSFLKSICGCIHLKVN